MKSEPDPRHVVRMPGGVSLMVRARWFQALSIAVAAAVIMLVRLPSVASATLWAEDGSTLLSDRLTNGAGANLFTPFDGYLHVVPRLVTDLLVTILPLDGVAIGIAVACAILTGLIAGLIFVLSRQLVPWLPARILLALLVVLAPTGPREVFGNLANLHWIFLWVTPWLLLGRVKSLTGSVLLGVATLAMALTEIQMIVFLPLLLWRWRDRRVWPIAGGLIVGFAAQLVAANAAPRSAPPDPVAFLSVVEGYLAQPVLGAVFGWSGASGKILSVTGMIAPVLILAIAIALTLYIVRKGAHEQRVLSVALIGGSAILWVAAVTINGWAGLDYAYFTIEDWLGFTFLRYAYIGSLLLLALLPITASVLHDRQVRVLPWVIVLGVTVMLLVSFRIDSTRRDHGPIWSDAVDTARSECSAPGTTAVDIPLAPRGWSVTIPCAALDGSAR